MATRWRWPPDSSKMERHSIEDGDATSSSGLRTRARLPSKLEAVLILTVWYPPRGVALSGRELVTAAGR